LSGLDEQIAYVVELHPYASLDERSTLAHEVEPQKKLKGKGTVTMPNPHPYTFQKPSYVTLKTTLNTNTRPP